MMLIMHNIFFKIFDVDDKWTRGKVSITSDDEPHHRRKWRGTLRWFRFPELWPVCWLRSDLWFRPASWCCGCPPAEVEGSEWPHSWTPLPTATADSSSGARGWIRSGRPTAAKASAWNAVWARRPALDTLLRSAVRLDIGGRSCNGCDLRPDSSRGPCRPAGPAGKPATRVASDPICRTGDQPGSCGSRTCEVAGKCSHLCVVNKKKLKHVSYAKARCRPLTALVDWPLIAERRKQRAACSRRTALRRSASSLVNRMSWRAASPYCPTFLRHSEAKTAHRVAQFAILFHEDRRIIEQLKYGMIALTCKYGDRWWGPLQSSGTEYCDRIRPGGRRRGQPSRRLRRSGARPDPLRNPSWPCGTTCRPVRSVPTEKPNRPSAAPAAELIPDGN